MTLIFYIWMMYSILSQFDLTQKEIEIFVLLIQYNKAAASTLAQQANLSRTHAYELLQ
jgi:sugar-specific transcriptional regulator TrmB